MFATRTDTVLIHMVVQQLRKINAKCKTGPVLTAKYKKASRYYKVKNQTLNHSYS